MILIQFLVFLILLLELFYHASMLFFSIILLTPKIVISTKKENIKQISKKCFETDIATFSILIIALIILFNRNSNEMICLLQKIEKA